jgi:hypothetical protein
MNRQSLPIAKNGSTIELVANLCPEKWKQRLLENASSVNDGVGVGAYLLCEAN